MASFPDPKYFGRFWGEADIGRAARHFVQVAIDPKQTCK
jgi:hypothetical protein